MSRQILQSVGNATTVVNDPVRVELNNENQNCSVELTTNKNLDRGDLQVADTLQALSLTKDNTALFSQLGNTAPGATDFFSAELRLTVDDDTTPTTGVCSISVNGDEVFTLNNVQLTLPVNLQMGNMVFSPTSNNISGAAIYASPIANAVSDTRLAAIGTVAQMINDVSSSEAGLAVQFVQTVDDVPSAQGTLTGFNTNVTERTFVTVDASGFYSIAQATFAVGGVFRFEVCLSAAYSQLTGDLANITLQENEAFNVGDPEVGWTQMTQADGVTPNPAAQMAIPQLASVNQPTMVQFSVVKQIQAGTDYNTFRFRLYLTSGDDTVSQVYKNGSSMVVLKS